MRHTAFIASALTYLQDSPLDRALFYRGDPTVMGLFEFDGRYRKSASVYKLFGALLDTPQRLAVSGTDDHSLALLAGRSGDGNLIQLIITQYGGKAGSEYKLNLQNLPWGEAEFELRRYKISDEASPRSEPLLGRGGKFQVIGSLSSNDVEFLVLRKR